MSGIQIQALHRKLQLPPVYPRQIIDSAGFETFDPTYMVFAWRLSLRRPYLQTLGSRSDKGLTDFTEGRPRIDEQVEHEEFARYS